MIKCTPCVLNASSGALDLEVKSIAAANNAVSAAWLKAPLHHSDFCVRFLLTTAKVALQRRFLTNNYYSPATAFKFHSNVREVLTATSTPAKERQGIKRRASCRGCERLRGMRRCAFCAKNKRRLILSSASAALLFASALERRGPPAFYF
jgi:hypothetical protein